MRERLSICEQVNVSVSCKSGRLTFQWLLGEKVVRHTLYPLIKSFDLSQDHRQILQHQSTWHVGDLSHKLSQIMTNATSDVCNKNSIRPDFGALD